jgi:hypothetical protein
VRDLKGGQQGVRSALKATGKAKALIRYVHKALSVSALGLLLSACSLTGGEKSPAGLRAGIVPAKEAPRTYRLTEADITVPPVHMFLGNKVQMLETYFGAPGLTRKEGEAQILQFVTQTPFGTCSVLAFVYEDRGLEPTITHISVREGSEIAAEPIHCLRELAMSQRTLKTG